MNLLVVTTHTDIDQRLHKMIQEKALPEANYSVVVEFFQAETAVGENFPQTFALDDLRNREAIDLAVEQCRAWGPFDKIIATDEYAVYLAAEIRERLGMPGSWRTDVVRFRDKVAMKKSLEGSPVRTPRMYSLESLLTDASLFPVVEKPRSYAGSKGIHILHNAERLQQEVADQQHAEFIEFNMTDVEYEEFIEGRIFHIDGLVMNSEIIYCVASEYIGSCLNFLKGHPLGSVSEPDHAEQALWRAFADQVRAGMTVPDGAFHLEAFLTPKNERVFLEIGIRPGGAFVVPSIERACGFNLDLAHIQCQLGIHPSLPKERQEYGWLAFPKKFDSEETNYVQDVSGPSLAHLPGLVWSEIPEVGAPYSGSFSYTKGLGSFVFCSPSSKTIRQSIQTLLSGYRVSGGTHFETQDSEPRPSLAATS